MKQLGELSLQEYGTLKQIGMLWELFPDATGNVDDDLDCVVWREFEVGIHGKLRVKYFYDIEDEENVV
jgi:hypothetical protein